MYPVIALIGRPNVGKSTIFNRLISKRKAVISNVPGTTRDRIYDTFEVKKQKCILIDTGGIIKSSKTDEIEIGIQEQTKIAIEEANLIVFVLDGQAGLFPEDMKIIRELHKSKKSFLIILNKIDSVNIEQNSVNKFKKLGVDFVSISGIHGLGFNDLNIKLKEAIKQMEENEEINSDFIMGTDITISLVGKPNVGKSSIMNALTGKNTSLVSNISGTTRDSVDTNLKYKEKLVKIVDTAGLKRKVKIDSDIDYYSYLRAIKSLQRSDIAILVIDATQIISHYEKTIFQQINELYKGCILVVNKWDLIEKDTNTMAEYTQYLRTALPFCKWVPIIYTSAVQNQRLTNVLDKVLEIDIQRTKKIGTSLLNKFLEESKIEHQPAAKNSRQKRPKMYYITQTDINPPTFIIFMNDSKILHSSYLKYLERNFREMFDFEGTPIRLITKGKKTLK